MSRPLQQRQRLFVGVALAMLCLTTAVFARPSDQESADVSSDAATASAGLLPLPDYSGGLGERLFLLGDWGGARTSLADRGVQLEVDFLQHLQSVVDGGRGTGTRYGGSLEYLLRLDLDRMGALPGALVTVRGESRYGESVNALAGTLLPANTDMYFPLTSEVDEDIPFTITEFTYTQFLSETFAVVVGKLNTLTAGGDGNEFASGRGRTQFSNGNFVFHPVSGFVPYSTLGVGAVSYPSPNASISGALMNTADASTTTGFGDFGEGWTANIEVQFSYELWGRPGGQNIGGIYGGDGDYTDLGGRFFLPSGVRLRPVSDETWSVYWTGWQYLWTDESDETPVDPFNGVPDRRGIGVFARFGFGDQDTLPVEWHFSAGLGGRGPIAGRPDDHYGLGYFYNRIQPERLTSTARIEDQSQGFEGFYNASLTPAARLTGSLQVIDDASTATDTAIIIGARLQLRF